MFTFLHRVHAAAGSERRTGQNYWLVQRISASPFKGAGPKSELRGNPFGYGNLGDYDLDYMGSSEFEWGALPAAYDRLAKARRDLVLTEWEYNGHALDFLYIGKEGEPFEEWTAWAEGRAFDPYTDRTYTVPNFDSKERPYELERRLAGDPEPSHGWRTDIWWALDANVMWAFHGDGHLPRMLKSIGTTKTVSLRG